MVYLGKNEKIRKLQIFKNKLKFMSDIIFRNGESTHISVPTQRPTYLD